MRVSETETPPAPVDETVCPDREAKSRPLQDAADEVINPVAYDDKLDIVSDAKLVESWECRVDFKRVQRIVQLGQTCVDKFHLTPHTFCGPDLASFP
jgi:hypothetical protein